MPDQIRVGTRKGLVSVSRTSAGWHVDGLTADAIPVTALLDRGPDAPLLVGCDHGHFGPKLFATADEGATLRDLAMPEHPNPAEGQEPDLDPNRRDAVPASTELIWALEATSDGTVWCGTSPGGLFSSGDEGATWTLNAGLWDQPWRPEWFGGGFDNPAIHSIVTDPRSPDRLAVGISAGGAWRTTDGGLTWATGTGMAARYMPPDRVDDPAIQDPHRIVRSPVQPDVLWTQHHSGIFRSTDDGQTWVEVTEAGPSTFGFAVATHPSDADTAWFVPAISDEERIPADGKLVVTRTRDGGSSFDVLSTGLPEQSWDLIYRHALAVDETGDVLAMGSTTGNLWVSEDAGDSWTLVSSYLPPIAVVQFAA